MSTFPFQRNIALPYLKTSVQQPPEPPSINRLAVFTYSGTGMPKTQLEWEKPQEMFGHALTGVITNAKRERLQRQV